MSAENIIVTLHQASIFSMFLSGVYILAIRGARPPIVYLSLLAHLMIEGSIKYIGVPFYNLEPVIITILVLRQKDLYRIPERGKKVISAQKDDPSEWSSKKRKKLKHDLLVMLRKDEIFKDSELNNEKVCEMLGTNRTYLWQVINQDMNTTFYKLVNTCRLDKATTMNFG